MLNLHSPRVFQSLMVRSREAETICLLSAEKETLDISLVQGSCETSKLPNSQFQSPQIPPDHGHPQSTMPTTVPILIIAQRMD